MLAVIGGSGLYDLEGLAVADRRDVSTPYGVPSSPLVRGGFGGEEVLFLARHGIGHVIAPHLIEARANVRALADAGAEAILAVSSVGAIAESMPPGALVLPDQLIDYGGGGRTFFGRGRPVTHTDFTRPYSPELRERVLVAAGREGVELTDGATYASVTGPRFETAAEVARMRRDGCDVVGMTGMPEAILSRELGIPYCALCPVGNWAAGTAGARPELDAAEIVETSRIALQAASAVIRAMTLAP